MAQESKAYQAREERFRTILPEPCSSDGSGCVQHWEGVDDEPELFVREKRVQGDEDDAGEEEDN